jgi:hypothetical protein
VPLTEGTRTEPAGLITALETDLLYWLPLPSINRLEAIAFPSKPACKALGSVAKWVLGFTE